MRFSDADVDKKLRISTTEAQLGLAFELAKLELKLELELKFEIKLESELGVELGVELELDLEL